MACAARLVFVALVTAACLIEADAQPANQKVPGEDWVQLFNGKDLTGWVEVGKEKWEVQDGVLHGQATTKQYGYLKTAKCYDCHGAHDIRAIGVCLIYSYAKEFSLAGALATIMLVLTLALTGFYIRQMLKEDEL